jgi:hypothetical protein
MKKENAFNGDETAIILKFKENTLDMIGRR